MEPLLLSLVPQDNKHPRFAVKTQAGDTGDGGVCCCCYCCCCYCCLLLLLVAAVAAVCVLLLLPLLLLLLLLAVAAAAYLSSAPPALVAVNPPSDCLALVCFLVLGVHLCVALSAPPNPLRLAQAALYALGTLRSLGRTEFTTKQVGQATRWRCSWAYAFPCLLSLLPPIARGGR